MPIRVILVETEYSSNLGAVCRVMKNFDFSELFLVNPKCDVRNIDAYKSAKHAKDILENAKIETSLERAARGCDILVGTTGIKVRNKGTIRGVLPLREFAKKYKYYSDKTLGIVFGREGIGLTEAELNLCDLVVHIETSPAYPVLNLSHAAAVILYALTSFKGTQGERKPSIGELAALKLLFSRISARFKRKNMLAPVAFKRIISRAHINEHETKALLNLFRLIEEELDKIKPYAEPPRESN